MGGEPWQHYVPYREDVAGALRDLQQREFAAGRYDPWGVLAGMGRRPRSIDELRALSEDSGTGTVLDMLGIARGPQLLMACPVPPEYLREFYGAERPERAAVEAGMDALFEELERGHGVYVVVWREGRHDELLFAGYSLD